VCNAFPSSLQSHGKDPNNLFHKGGRADMPVAPVSTWSTNQAY